MLHNTKNLKLPQEIFQWGPGLFFLHIGAVRKMMQPHSFRQENDEGRAELRRGAVVVPVSRTKQ